MHGLLPGRPVRGCQNGPGEESCQPGANIGTLGMFRAGLRHTWRVSRAGPYKVMTIGRWIVMREETSGRSETIGETFQG